MLLEQAELAVTDPIELGRGTIQGDIPSQVLFLIFIEPLLRWLQSGGRGYRHKCLIAAMTGSIANMKVQAQKVHAFVAWSKLTVNCKKYAITNMLYEQAQNMVAAVYSLKA